MWESQYWSVSRAHKFPPTSPSPLHEGGQIDGKTINRWKKTENGVKSNIIKLVSGVLLYKPFGSD